MNEVKIKVKAKDETKPEVEKAKKNVKEMEKSISLDFKKMSTNILGSVRSMAKFGATAAGIASLIGPATSGMLAVAKGVAALGHQLTLIAPASATLPALASAVGLVVGTIKLAGPAMIKSLSPIGDAFKRIQGEVGNLASKGLRPLANEFVRVNFPSVHKAMDEIATSINRVVANSIAWVNTGQGQHAIAGITTATAAAMKNLEGPLSRVVMSFGNMVNRVGGGVIGRIGNDVGKLADSASRLMNNVTKQNAAEAIDKIAGSFGHIRDAFVALKDVGGWMAKNQEEVKKFSDAMAGIGIVVGLATGNIPAVLAGSFSLIVNHWQSIKSIFAGAVPFFSGIWDSVRNDPNVQNIWDGIKGAWESFVGGFSRWMPEIKANFEKYIGAMIQVWNQFSPLIAAWWKAAAPVFFALGWALGAGITLWLDWAAKVDTALAVVGGAIRGMVMFALNMFGTLVNGAAAAFSWLPGVGPKLQSAANDFNAFRDRVNASLAGIHDKHVTITVEEVRRTSTVNVTPQTLMHGLRTGGVMGAGHAAGGGPRSGMTWVGESGPELVHLPAGSMVRTAGSSRAMASNGGGPVVVNNYISSGSQVDDFFVSILRKAVQRRGGNVQEVLGT